MPGSVPANCTIMQSFTLGVIDGPEIVVPAVDRPAWSLALIGFVDETLRYAMTTAIPVSVAPNTFVIVHDAPSPLWTL